MDNPLPANTAVIDFNLSRGDFSLDASVEVPTGVISPAALLPILQDLASSIVDSAVASAAASGATVSCSAGCGACCRQLVPISLFEAEALADWIATLPPLHQQELERRFHNALTQLEQRGLLASLRTTLWSGTLEERRALALAYFHAGVPCPFLENESCGIYPIRPLICREYLVTSPAERCADPSPERVDKIKLPVKLSTALARLAASTEPDGRGWLPLVFLLDRIASGATPHSASAAPGPEVVDRFLHHCATGEAEPQA